MVEGIPLHSEYYAGTSKRILYHLDNTMAFYRTTANEYFEMTPTNLALLNRNRGDTVLTGMPSGVPKDFTFFFPTVMWMQAIFLGYEPQYPGYVTPGTFQVSVSPNTTGLDDGDWYPIDMVPWWDGTLWYFRQKIVALHGEPVLNVKALRIDTWPDGAERIHLYGVPAEPTPVFGDLMLLRPDGTALTSEEMWLGDMTWNVQEPEDFDIYIPPPTLSPEVSFRVKNASTRTALGVGVSFEYLQLSDYDQYLPFKEVKVNSGDWIPSGPNVPYSVELGDLAPGATSSQLLTYRLRLNSLLYYNGYPSWYYPFPIVLRPFVSGWS